MRVLVRPLNFTDKLLRLLETVQNNCRTCRRCMCVRERWLRKEKERQRSAKNGRAGERECEEKVGGKTSLTIYYVGCQLGAGCPRNEFIKYFIRARERRKSKRRRMGDGVAADTKATEYTELYKRTPFFIIRRHVTTLYVTRRKTHA